jgi:probable phosphoglycerate mutase
VTPLVAIRHAPTAWNRARRLQGRTDIPLDEAGEAVARSWAVPDEWRGYHVLSSPLQRARRTAQILFPDREIAIDARLIEIGFGDWEGEVLAELRARPGGDAGRANPSASISAPPAARRRATCRRGSGLCWSRSTRRDVRPSSSPTKR